jgi:hypothetical protein
MEEVDSDDDCSDSASMISEEQIPDPADTTITSDQYLTCTTCAERVVVPPIVSENIDEQMLDDPIPSVSTHPTDGSRCWLCTFAPHPTAIEMHNFIIANISCMDVKYIANQVRDTIMERFTHSSGARRRDVRRHITQHMISPQVKIASTIRSLIEVADTLKGGLTHRDPETNEVLVDIKNTELYLKVTSQVITAYKLDTTKLLFGKRE